MEDEEAMEMTDSAHAHEDAHQTYTRTSASEHVYTPGEPVWWHDQPRGGYGAFHPVRATFHRYNPKTVTIAAELRSGGSRRVRVPLSSISPREMSALTEADTPVWWRNAQTGARVEAVFVRMENLAGINHALITVGEQQHYVMAGTLSVRQEVAR